MWKKICKAANSIEESIICFIVRRAGKWVSILNKQVEDEVQSHALEIIKSNERAGIDCDLSKTIGDMRAFRAENVKFAFGHVLSIVAIIFSMIAILVSLMK